ncbi:ATPase, AAA family [Citrifermentans bemidjiense Bem]|uniref:ATPase, AAA family n=1 Tax=Citrifermentans bemidjiense (strain ATCC BAA-1014 / DSM 16622 / JCM 12645 / Bem) TaxID=404380 RepID=B5EGT4_CITBB|nr:ATP-binding protein [Citrifermentans bemidjiense]ACH39567.1 ATPase, AAA family [Citrifermentans bemidjiense Bem]
MRKVDYQPHLSPDAANLQLALDWLAHLVSGYLGVRFGKADAFQARPLELCSEDSPLELFIKSQNPTLEEFALVMMALAPHLQPGFFNRIVSEVLPEGGDIPELGGVRLAENRAILPTGETAQFVLAGHSLGRSIEVQRLLSAEHWLAKKRILWLEPVRPGEPMMSGRLCLDPELVEWVTLGTVGRPRFSMEFPAEAIETEMVWEDLVLHPNTLRQIHEIENWIKHNETLLNEWGMKRKLKQGYRALFHGPSGTGKTLTATLLGKYTGRDVYRIDLSRVVSKYIGETEKNLSALFDKAEYKEWILFFDEADALFGKRTDVRDSHDRYANQEVSYLLQRLEGYHGLVILATNKRSNLDEAFVRRFQSIIQFPMPRAEERCRIWRQAFPQQIEISEDIDWKEIAARYELPGAGIMNVMHHCALEVLADQSRRLDLTRLEAAIMREYIKEGKVV